jgi:hypothetical protein
VRCEKRNKQDAESSEANLIAAALQAKRLYDEMHPMDEEVGFPEADPLEQQGDTFVANQSKRVSNFDFSKAENAGCTWVEIVCYAKIRYANNLRGKVERIEMFRSLKNSNDVRMSLPTGALVKYVERDIAFIRALPLAFQSMKDPNC